MINNARRQTPNSGVLFTNNKKKGESSPDFTGEIDIAGKVMALSGWWKEPKSATSTAGRFLSLKAREPLVRR